MALALMFCAPPIPCVRGRYSSVRRQGGAPEKETQVLDYSVQQYRLFPLIAAAYAFRFTGAYMSQLVSDLKVRQPLTTYAGHVEKLKF